MGVAHPLDAGVCWGMTNLVVSLMLTRMIQGLFSGRGSIDRMPGAMGQYGPRRDLDRGPLVYAKLGGFRAKIARSIGLWSPIGESNSGPHAKAIIVCVLWIVGLAELGYSAT